MSRIGNELKMRSVLIREDLRLTSESENRVQHKDGTFRWMLSRGLAVRDDSSGKASRMAGSQTDITAVESGRCTDLDGFAESTVVY